MRTAVFILAFAVVAPAAAVAAPACGQFEDPLAYNACLARQGPTARPVHMGAAPAVRATPRVAARHYALAARGGRAEMVFSLRR